MYSWLKPRNLFRTGSALIAMGLLSTIGCSLEQFRAAFAGVDAAARSLQGEEDDDTTFGEWLLEELGDLDD